MYLLRVMREAETTETRVTLMHCNQKEKVSFKQLGTWFFLETSLGKQISGPQFQDSLIIYQDPSAIRADWQTLHRPV